MQRRSTKANGVRFISREEIPCNLKRRIANWAKDGRVLHGPVKITKFREYEDCYSLNLILCNCVEDEMGAHNFGFSVKFKKYKK